MGISDTNGPRAAQVHKHYGPDAWVEGRAEEQLEQVSRWPGILEISAFPDLHPGRYGPVGAAFLADRVYPQLIGPDIGCGMSVFRLDLPERKFRADKAVKRLSVLDDGADAEEAETALGERCVRLSTSGLGTIGGGNHFCEVQVVTRASDGSPIRTGELCLLVHSWSRGVGAEIFRQTASSWIHGYETGSPEAEAYLSLHDEAVFWASANRCMIAKLAAEALRCQAEMVCDAVHNAVERTEVGWVHRKGAARPDRGFAPLAGSRDAESFLMRVHDNARALGSVSHGAGRKHDRSSMHGRIQKTRSALEGMRRNPWGGHVVCADSNLLIEEAGKAYKDPSAVVSELERAEAATRVATLRPLLTYKTGERR